ncbi:type II secretion system protein [Allorhodopirellula solitaria]|uniref:Type II secretion system protein G n=1 Tax=Allorhodopirellula solitaria TaxID=2527987 RepID=A0A5C5YGC5_9BACT|nr:type II secretion system protein [Allorhodopirellula solitaria]TWT74174.1 hypothetical protein CA85_10610 [Allorhodopirellula solitaria]
MSDRSTVINRNRDRRVGFTLVEILVVLVIIGLMGGMVLAAVQGVTNSARASRTRTIIAACDSVIQEQYESYKYRPLPVDIPTLSQVVDHDNNTSTPDVLVSFEVLATEAARVRLIMTRDLQRMEMPDKRLDVVFNMTGPVQTDAVTITAVANRVVSDTTSGRAIRQYSNRRQMPIAWERTQKAYTYYDRFLSAGQTWTTENEGAECLYLIMATSFANGSPAIDSIPSASIGDTDGDGMREILDGWGRPLGFIRWPVGYINDDDALVDQTIPDDFDPFHVDFGHFVSGAGFPWAMRPLIVSAGGDDEFGMSLSSNTVSYNTQSWPLSEMDSGTKVVVGDEAEGRTGTYVFPDPYLRHNAPSSLPGAELNTELVSDNITNYALAGSQ